jgi:hypothetical protein
MARNKTLRETSGYPMVVSKSVWCGVTIARDCAANKIHLQISRCPISYALQLRAWRRWPSRVRLRWPGPSFIDELEKRLLAFQDFLRLAPSGPAIAPEKLRRELIYSE